MTTRTEDLVAGLAPEVRKLARLRPQPSWVSPMLATLVAEPFSGPDWIFEPKLDGERCLTFRRDGDLRLFSRNQKPLNGTYPELVSPLARQASTDYIVDGEIVAFQGAVTSFAQLQRRMQIRDPEDARHRGIRVFYYLFDLLYLDGYDLRDVPLSYRKLLLRRAFPFRDPLRFTEHREREGEAYYRECCRQHLEGIMAKRVESRYVSKRSRDWLKVKCWAAQEFVIGGYTDPRGSRTGFGALLLGYYDGGELVYAGKVGTGFNTEILQHLGKQLAALETTRSPFAGDVPVRKGIHWVRPHLVAQVRFTEWTGDDRLRHPRFLGIRTDKDPREVVRERPN
jgi:bifunctional non-homologous end joining protein LigD